MKNKLTNDLSLLEEMIKDQNSKYKVDPFWKNYEYSNVTKIIVAIIIEPPIINSFACFFKNSLFIT